MRPAVIALALLALTGHAASAQDLTLVLPHPLRTGETAWLQVQLGPIGRGQEVDVTTAAGQELGAISPFGVRVGQDAGTYTLPLPTDAIRDGRVSVRLSLTGTGAAPRTPTAQEVLGVKLIVTSAAH